jgi:hypothetical protein
MKFSGILLIILSTTQLSYGAQEIALSMVPRGKLVDNFGRNFTVKTLAGTKINIEFKLDGKFDEARGLNLNKGDELEPGEGLISLSTAAQKLSQLGAKPQGYWHLEEDQKLGWVYEFEDKLVNARSGEIIKQ